MSGRGGRGGGRGGRGGSRGKPAPPGMPGGDDPSLIVNDQPQETYPVSNPVMRLYCADQTSAERTQSAPFSTSLPICFNKSLAEIL